jgi:hypothetical protein
MALAKCTHKQLKPCDALHKPWLLLLLLLTRTPSCSTAFMPISTLSSTVQPCSTAPWPTDTPLPILVLLLLGLRDPTDTPSCRLVLWPISTWWLSPASALLYRCCCCLFHCFSLSCRRKTLQAAGLVNRVLSSVLTCEYDCLLHPNFKAWCTNVHNKSAHPAAAAAAAVCMLLASC